MQGTRLALIALLACLALAGCGGGSSSTTASETTQAKSPQGVEEAAAQLKDSAARVKREREGEEADQGKSTGSGSNQANSQDHAAALPPARPQNTHHDSGGGTSQFATKTGDNSIQESGREGSPTETEEAAAVLHAYLDARVANQWSDACFYLAASYVATIELFAERYAKGKGVKSCPEVLEALASGSGQQVLSVTAKADVGALRIQGDHGFLLYHGAEGAPYAMPMVREGGAWKVGSLDGAPLGG